MGCSSSAGKNSSVSAGGGQPNGKPNAADKGSGSKSGGGQSRQRLMDDYAVGELLGEGAFGVVYACTERGTNKELAVKMVDKVETPVHLIKEEAEMLRKMNHPNIVKLHRVIFERCFVCIVMDRYGGGDLVEGMQLHRKTKGRISCHAIVHISQQMASSIHYLHQQQVIHRDVKGDNYLMDRRDIVDSKCHVALSDFGTAKKIGPNDRLHDECGTKIFWSPEFFDKNYGYKVDIWAMGVIMYGLLDGRFPFKDQVDVRNKNIVLPKGTAPICEEYVKNLLQKDEDKRLSSAQAANHAWNSSNPAAASPSGGAAPGGDLDKEEVQKLGLREGGANVAQADRRRELVGRLQEQEAKKGGGDKGKSGGDQKHFWMLWFTIVDKHAGNATLKFEWWTPAKIEKEKILNLEGATLAKDSGANEQSSVQVVAKMLREHSISVEAWGTGNAKSLDTFASEVQRGASRLMLDATEHKKLVRVVDVVLLRICVDVNGSRRFLVECREVLPDGRTREVFRLPGTKKEPEENTKKTGERILSDMLNMADCDVAFDFKSKEVFEAQEESPSFPGVTTVYRKEIIEGHVRVTDEGVRSRIALPGCGEFSSKDSKQNTKFFTWLDEPACASKNVKLRVPEEEEEVSGLVQAPVGMNEEDLSRYLQTNNVDITQFGQNHTKTLKEFSMELMKGESSLMQDKGSVIRIVDIVLVKLVNAATQSVLVQTDLVYPDGHKLVHNRLPGTKRRPDENQYLTAWRVLRRQLKMHENYVNLDNSNVQIVEEEQDSHSYPGLRTVYRKRIITAELIRNPA